MASTTPVRSLLLLPLALLAFTGCATPDTPAAPVDAPAVEPAPAPAAAMTATYQCPGGQTIEASYPTDSTAVVVRAGQTHEMTIAVSGSGARYVGGDLEWWTKGSGPGAEGTIFRHGSDGTTGELVETCTQS